MEGTGIVFLSMKTTTDGSLVVTRPTYALTACPSSTPTCLLGYPDHLGGGGGRRPGRWRVTEEREKSWWDGLEVAEEGVAASQSVNGLKGRPGQKGLVCVALFTAAVFV